MIEIKIQFYTEEIAGTPATVIPKNAWTHGVVRIKSNTTHGIVSKGDRHFHSLMEIPSAMEEVLIEHGIVLHPSKTMRKYVK